MQTNKIINKIKSMKGKEPIVMLTCYDYTTAKVLEKLKIDIILVGDSLGNVVLGYNNTRYVTMHDMVRHTSAVRRGAPKSFIVADMPYNSDTNKELAIKNATILIKSGADAVKIEGKPAICKALVESRINVMGHVGHLPQTAGKPIVHRDKDKLLEDSRRLEKAGVFAIVLEMVQMDIAKNITETLKIPTIGIGAGPYCDGQVLVTPDLLGIYDDFKPSFVKRYANINNEIKRAIEKYKEEVKNRIFPSKEYSFK